MDTTEYKTRLVADLNPAQREAVLAPPEPLLIIAGAGSGKTRVLTHRIAYFIASGVKPWQILAITFTNKAADEMKKRVSKLIGDGQTWQGAVEMPFIGTFHSLALRILREDCDAIGIPKSFVVADDPDTLSIMKRVMKQMKIMPDRIAPSDALNRISREKNELHSPDEMAVSDENDALVRSLYTAYQQTLNRESLLDFDDLLFFAVRLLNTNAEILEKYRHRWQHIFVDEYQDTNGSQYQLVKLLAMEHRSITVVGDDYQAIYGWRGADYRNILNFHKDYPGTRIVKLEQNYRSTQRILDAADGIIKKVAARTEKTLIATREKGAPISITELTSERDEASYIIETILALKKKGLRLSDIVVLYRTNAQTRPFEEIFLQSRIPYRIIGGLRFYERKEVKDVLAFLRYLKNDQDHTALERIINIPPRGIGKVGLERIRERGLDAVADTSEPARDFRALLRHLREKQTTVTLSQFMKELLKAIDYKAFLREAYASARTWRADESEERWENIEELFKSASRYDALTPPEALERFLEDIALYSHIDALDASAEAINLMTMHLAKGLEFPTVFLTGLEEGLLPHARSIGDPERMDEERRLCYVALTRAKDRAYLTFSRERTIHGDRSLRLPSRFISDIPEHLTEYRGRDLFEPELVEGDDAW